MRPRYDRTGRFLGYRGTGHEVTESRRLARRIEQRATHDPLTGLLNREELERRLAEHLARRDAAARVNALDLDDFHVVNDLCGDLAGDPLLRELGSGDLLARFGGDVFWAVLERETLEQLVEVAERLRRTVAEYRLTWQGKLSRRPPRRTTVHHRAANPSSATRPC